VYPHYQGVPVSKWTVLHWADCTIFEERLGCWSL